VQPPIPPEEEVEVALPVQLEQAKMVEQEELHPVFLTALVLAVEEDRTVEVQRLALLEPTVVQ
jgi:hypothetical protein